MITGAGVLILVVASAAAGILMIVKARRKGSPYPSCGKCGYDVTGTLGTAVRCPECGSDFAEAGIRPPGTRMNRPLLVAGVVVLVFVVGCFGTGIVSMTYAMRRAVSAQQRAVIAQQQAILAQQQFVQAELEAQEAQGLAEAEEAEVQSETTEPPADAGEPRPPRPPG